MSRLNAVIHYLQEYGDANTAYNDLRQFVEALEPNERARLLSMLDQNTGLEKSQQKIGPSSPHTNNAQKVCRRANCFISEAALSSKLVLTEVLVIHCFSDY